MTSQQPTQRLQGKVAVITGAGSGIGLAIATRGIRCNAICPGGTRTNIAETMPQERLDPAGAARTGAYAALIPVFMEPTDMADLALFLACDESKRINGAIIAADGGWTAA